MDLAKDDYVVSMDAVQPRLQIIRKGIQEDTHNLENLENEEIKDSLTTLMLTVSEKGTASARRSRNTASRPAAEKVSSI